MISKMRKQVFNPFLPEDVYIPDGEPHVFGDRVYLFGSHDMEAGESFCLLDYEGWSAPVDDLGSWESAGTIYSAKQDPLYSEEKAYMYAPDVVRGNDGRFYLYYCLSGWKGAGGYDGPIGVAVCETPNGRYEFYGHVKNSDGTLFNEVVVFDPAVMNDNGTIRLYTGTDLANGVELSSLDEQQMAEVAEKIYHRPASEFSAEKSPLGAYMVVLADDMLTVLGEPKKILPKVTEDNGFRDHAFFEGPSIRKIGDIYYFIYSSQKNHELCYATSRFPDRDFVYGGTIVSAGDVGFNGRKDEDRLNVTGTTHGSIECIGGKWYVFYHRLSHGSDYSRQACAEQIEIDETTGAIRQVEVTSCGLNGGPLCAEGTVPATKACVITNGRMPQISNQKCSTSIPVVTNEGECHFITGIDRDTLVGFRYFDFDGKAKTIKLTYRAASDGIVKLYQSEDGPCICTLLAVASDTWNETEANCTFSAGVTPLYLRFEGKGTIDLKEIIL